ncbi:MAG: ABC transporter ATP-binding protein [Nitrososphaerales archaeon]
MTRSAFLTGQRGSVNTSAEPPDVSSNGDRGRTLLSVKNLKVDFSTVDGRVHVLNDVSFSVGQGEIVGIVGESGSGKTTLGLAILRLLDCPPAEIVGGSIVFDGKDLLKLGTRDLSRVRGCGINMVFQESLISLNPVYRVESDIKESIDVLCSSNRLSMAAQEKKELMLKVLKELCLDKPEIVLKKYPHELSGGMRQRVSIAMSIVQTPKLLILDEPTTGLDGYVQNRILQIIKKLNTELGMSMILITHDLTVASQICDGIYVMYSGRVLEVGRSNEILETPLHPYSETLLAALPLGYSDSGPLTVPAGEPPDLKQLPTGCKFHPRCPYAMEICRREEPQLAEPFGNAERMVSCWKYAEHQRE